ncbi:conserved hypothetical protein [Ricinus communis]|uniref:Protein SIEVE ELEMENT OCCLUSION B n=1 Tax=Ricinus communis TaxID=3988 RepID=B9SLU1_RICCO|nr:conserved hypothetical protein [Ricinus communis]|eukprot:XP_002526960.1 protein SIEVE ELEMENT OCCLUSION B isoform X1 [Ricinus communis]
MAYAASTSASQHLIKSEGSMAALSDEDSLMKLVQETHAPDDRKFDVRTLLNVLEDILINCESREIESIMPATQTHKETPDNSREVLESLSYIIDKLSSEISYKVLSGADGHRTTISFLNMLSNYSWDSKLVLIMLAFALNYGEFWLIAEIRFSNPFAKTMATLKQFRPFILEYAATSLKPTFDALNNLIRVMREVTKCVVEVGELSSEIPAYLELSALVQRATYWTTISAMACATQINTLAKLDNADQLAGELSTLADKLQNIHDRLRSQLTICYQQKDDMSYQMLLNLFKSVHIDNMKILKALICSKNDIQPLFDGYTKKRVNIDVLRQKNVLLLISDLHIPDYEIFFLETHYRITGNHLFEVVWIPIMDRTIKWNDLGQKQFESLQSKMPWYTVYHPTQIDKVVIKFIKEVWHFNNKPILVVLDPHGKVVSPNALHMMWIWGSHAFPFTSLREEMLWKEETWRLELLVDGIDPMLVNWVGEEEYIFLHGGDDVEWVKEFTEMVRKVSQAAQKPVEMVYLGKSYKKDKVRKIAKTITDEKLGHSWDPTMIWFFWTRLDSMLFSKIQLRKIDENDTLTHEIKKLISYDKEMGWALLSKGPNIVVNGHSTTVLRALTEYDKWKENVPVKGFDLSFKEHHDKLQNTNGPCCRFEFPSTFGEIPEHLKCPECLRSMEKHMAFRCCHDC